MALTLGEILVKPAEAGDTSLQQQYEQTISAGAMIVPFDQSTARAYAAIRKDRSIRPPDAIQLACAVNARVDLFITRVDVRPRVEALVHARHLPEARARLCGVTSSRILVDGGLMVLESTVTERSTTRPMRSLSRRAQD